jgi:hypothetical protein
MPKAKSPAPDKADKAAPEEKPKKVDKKAAKTAVQRLFKQVAEYLHDPDKHDEGGPEVYHLSDGLQECLAKSYLRLTKLGPLNLKDVFMVVEAYCAGNNYSDPLWSNKTGSRSWTSSSGSDWWKKGGSNNLLQATADGPDDEETADEGSAVGATDDVPENTYDGMV